LRLPEQWPRRGARRRHAHAGRLIGWLAWLCIAAPALATQSGATYTARRGPELSDVALFIVAAIAVWFTRRALRNRGRKG
jgi:membrane protein implicated in regulation of membrane protease activity